MSNDIMTNTNGEIVLYQPDKDTRLEVQIHDENVWLSIDQMSKLFGRDKSVIGKHIRTIFKEGELVKHSVWAKFAYSGSCTCPLTLYDRELQKKYIRIARNMGAGPRAISRITGIPYSIVQRVK